MACDDEAQVVLLSNLGNVRRADCRLCCARFAGLFPGLGIRANSGVFALIHLGWVQASLCGHEVYSLYRWKLTVYFGGGLSDGLLWRSSHL